MPARDLAVWVKEMHENLAPLPSPAPSQHMDPMLVVWITGLVLLPLFWILLVWLIDRYYKKDLRDREKP